MARHLPDEMKNYKINYQDRYTESLEHEKSREFNIYDKGKLKIDDDLPSKQNIKKQKCLIIMRHTHGVCSYLLVTQFSVSDTAF